MPHELTELKVKTVTKPAGDPAEELTADVCVVGAGIAGLSAAIEARRLGRSVVLADALPVLGGQCVNSLIGLFCGVYGNAPEYHRLTHGIFDRMFADLEKTGDIAYNRRHTITVAYDEVVLGRWIENLVYDLDIQVVLGASVLAVESDVDAATGERRLAAVTFATRHGRVRVRAEGFVDASGDAALAWEAGLPCRIPERTIWGSQQVRVENLRPEHRPEPAELVAAIKANAKRYDLPRLEGLAFFFQGRDWAVLNMTHVEAPLEAVRASRAQLEGRAQADRVVEFLRNEFPETFGEARVRSYGFPGRRQTRWLAAVHQLTVDEVRSGHRFADAVARTSWPIELHDRVEGYVWEEFGPDHVHYVPLRSLLAPGVHNMVAAGRCVDGDAAALSSVRVMGPCAAMGFAAAHALDLASGGGSVHEIDIAALRERVHENVDA